MSGPWWCSHAARAIATAYPVRWRCVLVSVCRPCWCWSPLVLLRLAHQRQQLARKVKKPSGIGWASGALLVSGCYSLPAASCACSSKACAAHSVFCTVSVTGADAFASKLMDSDARIACTCACRACTRSSASMRALMPRTWSLVAGLAACGASSKGQPRSARPSEASCAVSRRSYCETPGSSVVLGVSVCSLGWSSVG